MAKIDGVQEISIDLLKPYQNNAKIHGEEQVEAIKRSIREFGFISPCLIDKDYNLIAGHGRIMAAKQLGMRKVPCLFIEGLTDQQRKAYILADNRLTEMGSWDFDVVLEELDDIDIDMTAFGFDYEQKTDWFETRERFDDSREEGNEEYNEFLDKFEQPKTTDDCYTPDNIYDVVADYVAERFNKKREDFVRPFYPGGDYEKEKYKDGCVVVDNPPFSILAKIVDFYNARGIGFFLFAPGVTALHYLRKDNVTVMPIMASVTYENGAIVNTAFLTNLCEDDLIFDNDPDFRKKIDEANNENEKGLHKQLPKYEYPHDVLTGARAGYLSKHGQRITLKKGSLLVIDAMDEQKAIGKGIYGDGILLSKRAAEERAKAEHSATEKVAAELLNEDESTPRFIVFKLSDREKELQRTLV